MAAHFGYLEAREVVMDGDLARTIARAHVDEERRRQDEKWGEQNHDPFVWLGVLSEEVGEFAQAALHARFGGPADIGLVNEAIQVAAVALAIVECAERNDWSLVGAERGR